MSETPLSERQARLLAVVAEGGGNWDARRIDPTADARYGPGAETVLRELEELQRLGLAARDDSRSGAEGVVGGLDDLPQRLEVAPSGGLWPAFASRAEQDETGFAQGATITEWSFSKTQFSVDLVAKDVTLMLSATKIPLPATTAVLEELTAAQQSGRGGDDFSVIAEPELRLAMMRRSAPRGWPVRDAYPHRRTRIADAPAAVGRPSSAGTAEAVPAEQARCGAALQLGTRRLVSPHCCQHGIDHDGSGAQPSGMA